MGEPREATDVLRDALAALASTDAPALLAEARSAARERARTVIEDVLVEELLLAAGRTAARPGSRPASQAAAVPEPETRDAVGDAWWVYCVLRACDAEALPPDITGVESRNVGVVCEGDLAALVSRVPLAEYGDEQLRAHLEDIEWVARTARVHETVLDLALARVTIVPMRLCTLYRERDGVRKLLRDQRVTLSESLARVDGRAEWGLKVFADRGRLMASLAAEQEQSSPEPSSSGADYLARRRRERELRDRVDELGARWAEEIHTGVESIAEQARANSLQSPEAHGRAADMLLNGVYLVARDREAELRGAVAALRSRGEPAGLELELTGPWPPYNFVSTSAAVVS